MIADNFRNHIDGSVAIRNNPQGPAILHSAKQSLDFAIGSAMRNPQLRKIMHAKHRTPPAWLLTMIPQKISQKCGIQEWPFNRRFFKFYFRLKCQRSNSHSQFAVQANPIAG